MLFLGFAPNVTNGYYVMNQHDKIELTSNIADNPNFDAKEDLMELRPTEQPDPPQDPLYTEKELRVLEAVMGPEGGGGWFWQEDTALDEPDDPMQVVSTIHMAKVTDNLWKKEDIEPEEIPEGLKDEIKKSGAVMVALRSVRKSIGKDRQEWQLALEMSCSRCETAVRLKQLSMCHEISRFYL